jgi:hypothetical protein
VPETELRIISLGLRRRPQQDRRSVAQLLLGPPDQLGADAVLLMSVADHEIRQVGDVGEVGERARDPDQQIRLPGRDQQVGVADHLVDRIGVLQWAILAERRGAIKIDEGGRVRLDADGISDGHLSLSIEDGCRSRTHSRWGRTHGEDRLSG